MTRRPPRGRGAPHPAGRPGGPVRTYRGGTRGSANLRLRLGFLVITMVVSVFGARLVQLQAVDPYAYAAAATQEGLIEAVLPARRGDILDRHGVPLATSVDGLMLVADPVQTRARAPEIAKWLTLRLSVEYPDVLAALTRPGKRFAYLARRVPSTLALDVLADAGSRGYKGIDVRVDPLRDYPADDVAANVVGFVGSDGRALAGFEQAFDDHLGGTDGSETYEVGGGNRIPLGRNDREPAVDGQDLTTTLDQDLQWVVQRALATAVETSRAESGKVVVMDTRSGEILALADYPTYDASEPADYDKKLRGTRSLNAPYEPGSVEKVLTVGALLNEGEVTPYTRIEVPPTATVQGEVIHDWFDHGTLDWTLTGVLARSSNIGTVMASKKISPRRLHRYLTRFGLGTPSGVGVVGESAGLLPDGSTWTSLSRATIAFGQGLAVNAVQMAAAINTVANRGVYVSPSLVRGEATTDTGSRVGSGAATTRRVLVPRAARQLSMMMERVVDEEVGVAPLAAVPGYRVAGKTGTAQVVDADCACYLEDRYVVSFAGFAPADDPRFTVYVVLDKPAVAGGGGSLAGPVFSTVMGEVLRRYSIAPTGTRPSGLPVCGSRRDGGC